MNDHFPLRLLEHPSSALSRPFRLFASCRRSGLGVELGYRLQGSLDELCLDYDGIPLPLQKLWEHSCFECFLAGPGSTYREFNFAANGQQMQFQFADYRRREVEYEAQRLAEIETRRTATEFVLRARIADLGPTVADPAAIGISAVLEHRSGARSYWSLNHPAERPDFHDRRGWVAGSEGEPNC